PAPDSTIVMNEMDNCLDTVFVNFLEDRSSGSCPDTIQRIYLLADECGNTTELPQQIILNDEEAPTASPLASLGSFVCYDDLPAPDVSIVNAADNCSDPVSVTFVGDSDDPGCSGTVTRTYQISDRCGNTTLVTQTATINDTEAPVITCPRDIVEPVFTNVIGDCNAFVRLVATATDNCNRPVSITNDSQFADDPANGADASGEYPLGVTFVKFIADDGCGNLDSCTVRIEVIDIESPTLTCTTVRKDMGIDPITGDTIAVITVDDITIRGEVFDFCTPITTFFEKDTFTCEDFLVTPNPYMLTAIDTFDNINTCSPNRGVFLSDPLGLCGPTPPPAIVGGRIASAFDFGTQIEGVMVMANENAEMMDMSDQEGNYLINNLQSQQDYRIKPEKNDDYLNGVSTLDIIHISQHILGYQTIDNPYYLLAADVNRSNSISAADLVVLRQTILGQIDAFTNNGSWRFHQQGFRFSDPGDPFGESLPEDSYFESMQSDELAVDFVGFKVGDVTGDAKYRKGSEVRSNGLEQSLPITLQDEWLEAGQVYEVPFYAKDFDAVLGYQFTLQFDARALELVELIPGTVGAMSMEHFNTERSKEGLISTSFVNTSGAIEADAVLFTLKLKAYAKYQLSELLQINSELTAAEAYAQKGNSIATLRPELVFSESGKSNTNNTFTNTTQELRLYQNRPNPFNNQTIIGFELPQAARVTFRIFD
ncbi:MAG: cohesin domain-containing protein, partial [Bacteroidota bacterium]